ncbi:cx9C motif-containing protein 4 [Chelonus insularis]|uniref:cx9C motif-containing protein 4 n=1 Tax=Chelonus insularis TaxID=460826 RepID=UPI00158F2F0E|nr:cx9C motif-containing protein 4 [Chelonus insularis]
MNKTDPCKKYACQLQTCLKDNVYQPSRCTSVIENLRQCCRKHFEHSLVCEGIDISQPYEHKTIDYKQAIKK